MERGCEVTVALNGSVIQLGWGNKQRAVGADVWAVREVCSIIQ
jgi:hypothetical protein